ncbi:MAG: hypothetical protein AAF990_28395 [Bacteroidota bacterium]
MQSIVQGFNKASLALIGANFYIGPLTVAQNSNKYLCRVDLCGGAINPMKGLAGIVDIELMGRLLFDVQVGLPALLPNVKVMTEL